MTESQETITFRAIEVTQPIGTFYVGAIDASDLVAIAWADVQRIEKRKVEQFLGIQRELSEERVKELRKYVNTVDATFPTGIILAVSSRDAKYDSESGEMKLTRKDSVAKIIDGQHRIAGLEAFGGALFQTNVVIFVDMDIEDQAMVFATINLKQTRVSKSLAYNLFEYATFRSPQKTSHDIAKLLNTTEGALHDRIKILGRATPGVEGETITQAAFVDRLLPMITTDADADRDTIKRRRKLEEARPYSNLVFRNLFIAEKDAQIAKNLANYFGSVQRRWPRAWESRERGSVLSRTTGFAGLMRVLPSLIKARTSDLSSNGQVLEFDDALARSDLKDESFTTTRYPPGTSGESRLESDLIESMGL